jgi:4-amino-4-deoxy-L-arabinose transferase-like glycosyltransferase
MSEHEDSTGAESDGEQAGLTPAVASPRGRLAQLYRAVQPYEVLLVIGVALAVLIPGMWSYTLIDPWETHYGEVARRMLEESDWVHLKWQNEVFRSKPVLTFWLIGGSMSTFGVGDLGGFSGEMTASPLVIFAVRLPFVLFAVMGVTLLWVMLARLINRRVAWLSFLVMITTPFFFLVSRQAITDMPMVASLMGAIACFALAVHAEDEPLRPLWKKVNALHIFLAVLILFIGLQALYYILYFNAYPNLARGLRLKQPGLMLGGPILLVLAGFVAWSLFFQKVRTNRQVYMFWFYTLVGISVLAKGPPGIGLAGAVCLVYLIVTGEWRLIKKVEIPRGIVITSLVVVPWHVAMWMKDGRAWVNEYFNHHMLKRFGDGVHGDRGTFDYFASQVGIGMWPWAALIPAALASVLIAGVAKNREARVRLLIGIWAITGFGLFAASQTKFHHYILPAIPAMSILVALWLDDVLRGRVNRVALMSLTGVGITLLIARDFIGEQKQLIELFIYRYDRPWPTNAPWEVDVGGPILWFGIAFSVLLLLLGVRKIRRYIVVGLLGTALLFAYWCMNGYMSAAAAHWGQGALHQTYLQKRQIHGVEIKYYNLRHLADDWSKESSYRVQSVLPEGFAAGAPQRVTLHVPGAGVPDDKVTMQGTVASVGDMEFTIAVPDSERAKLAELIERGQRISARGKRPWIQVDADRLIAWQLNWRGENFWSGGEIWGETKDTQTVFMHTNNEKFLEYVKEPSRHGRKFFVVTEAGRAKGIAGVLPTKRAKETVEFLDTSSNKFTLLSFTL